MFQPRRLMNAQPIARADESTEPIPLDLEVPPAEFRQHSWPRQRRSRKPHPQSVPRDRRGHRRSTPFPRTLLAY